MTAMLVTLLSHYQPKLSKLKEGWHLERPGILLMLTWYCLYLPSRAIVTFAMTYLGCDSLKVFSYAIFVVHAIFIIK